MTVPSVGATTTSVALTRIPSKRSSCSNGPDGEVSAADKTIDAGSGWPLATTTKTGPPPISVVGGLGGAGANSDTTPLTRTESPTAGWIAAPLVNTNTPSDVCGLP